MLLALLALLLLLLPPLLPLLGFVPAEPLCEREEVYGPHEWSDVEGENVSALVQKLHKILAAVIADQVAVYVDVRECFVAVECTRQGIDHLEVI
jgi:hypothetical protein